MHFDLNDEEARTLRGLLQERVTQLDTQINHADSMRFKEELRREERQLERILGRLSGAVSETAKPAEWPPRDNVDDANRS